MTRGPSPSKILGLSCLSTLLLLGACRSEEPQVGSQTNWLKACDSSSECGELKCICGTCTVTCETADACGSFDSSSCVDNDAAGSIAICGGVATSDSLCLQRCEDGPCPSGSHCIAGVCSPEKAQSTTVSVDPESLGQELVGIGASISYDGDWIVAHPEKQAIYDALFRDAGLDVIRVRSRWNGNNPQNLTAAAEIVSEASARRGEPPVVLLSSSSPPEGLKANGVRFCGQTDPDCTLARAVDGTFDYPAFGTYWRDLLQAYETAGVTADFISIQNNPDWLPAFPEGGEACRFLPQEGTATVELADGTTTDVEFPGYDQALDAVRSAIAPLDRSYKLLSPETERISTVTAFTDTLAPSNYGAIGYHMFAVNPEDPPIDELQALKEISERTGLPHLQTEMAADAMGTAILIHHTLVTGGGAGYIQQQLVAQRMDAEGPAPIGSDGETFQLQPAFHALAHFSRHTDPGWSGIAADYDSENLLTSAWLSPDSDSLTLILVNQGDDTENVKISVPATWQDALTRASVIRSVFEGLERSADLGTLPSNGVTQVPSQSIVTVVATR